jgi:hypothetical protein
VVLPLDGDTLPAAAGTPGHAFAELIDWMPGFHATDAGDIVPMAKAGATSFFADLLARPASRRAGGCCGERHARPDRLRVTVDPFSADSGERLSHASDSASGNALTASRAPRGGTRGDGAAEGAIGPRRRCSRPPISRPRWDTCCRRSPFWVAIQGAASELEAAIRADRADSPTSAWA